jgi:hypothetical protein
MGSPEVLAAMRQHWRQEILAKVLAFYVLWSLGTMGFDVFFPKPLESFVVTFWYYALWGVGVILRSFYWLMAVVIGADVLLETTQRFIAALRCPRGTA